jgi:hypothetical protein
MRRRRVTSASPSADVGENPALEPLVEKLKEIIGGIATGRSFKVAAPWTATVLREDDSYRKVALVGSEEFFWTGVRLGKRGDMVFEFEPVDARPFKRMEMTTADVEAGRLVDFTDFVCGQLGVATIAAAKKEAKRFAKKAVEEAKAEEVKETTVRYTENPNFGSW